MKKFTEMLNNSIQIIKNSVILINISIDDIASIEIINQIPYVHSNRKKTQYYTSIENIQLVLSLFRNVNTVEDLNKLPADVRAVYSEIVSKQQKTRELIKEGPTKADSFLFPHQVWGVRIAELNKRFGFFFDVRTGKTIMGLQIIKNDITQNPTHRWLILCPLILMQNAWVSDAQKYFPDLKIQILHHAERKKRLEAFKLNASLYIINIESFVAYMDFIIGLNIHGVCLDESSKLKGNTTNLAKAIAKFARTVERWYLFSGTPAPNGAFEYYRQLQTLDYYGIPSSYTKFKEYFFLNTSRNPMYEKLMLNPEKSVEFINLLKKYSLYINIKDITETVKQVFKIVKLSLPEDLKEHYKQMYTNLYIEVQDETITAANMATKIGKLNQITSGFIYTENSNYLLNDYRFNSLYRLLFTIGTQQVVIWCAYKKEFEIIERALGSHCRCIYGDTTSKQNNESITLFKENKIQYLICHPASAGMGLTLTNAHIAIYFSLTYSLETWLQSIARIYGSKKIQQYDCIYYILIATNTVDQVIYDTLNNKGNISQALLDYVKKG